MKEAGGQYHLHFDEANSIAYGLNNSNSLMA